MRCYLDNSENTKLLKVVNGFDVYACGDCGLRWVEPRNKEKIHSLYNERYYKNDTLKTGYQDYWKHRKRYKKEAKNMLRIVDKVKGLNGLRILDIGCGFGYLLAEAKKYKCQVEGVEISAYARKMAKEKFGLNIFSNIACLNYFKPIFDVVFLIGTIEHLISPKEMLLNIKKILKQDGLLVITTIDTQGMLPVYFLKPPEHLFYFNHHNIALLLERFKILTREPKFVCLNFLPFVKIPNEMFLIARKEEK